MHAVVTGGSRGIGAAIVRELAAAGYDLTIMGRNLSALEDYVAELKKESSQSFLPLQVDVTRPSRVATGFKDAETELGSIQVLVNNAGAAISAPFEKTSPEVWSEMLAVNATSVYYCTQAVLPQMKEVGYGRIVNIASTASLTGYPYTTAYTAAKHAVLGLTRSLALEVAKSGITVNAVCPGFTDTELVSGSAKRVSEKTGKTVEQVKEEFAKSNPQGKLIQPAEVASAVVWLCDEKQASINGTSIVISGGEVL